MKFRTPLVALAALIAAACSDGSKLPTGVAAVGATDSKLWIGDLRPPEVTWSVTGEQLASGWYVSDVGITWSISDPDNTLLSTEGCEPATLTTDTADYAFMCQVTSLFGPSTYGVAVMRDATPPVMDVSGNQGTYTVDQTVSIACTASDPTSGVEQTDCGSVSGDALSFGLGEHISIASSTNRAGLGMVDWIRFNVVVTPGGVCGLVNRWVTTGVANSLCKELNDGDYDGFRKKLAQHTGRAISAANAATLLSLVNAL